MNKRSLSPLKRAVWSYYKKYGRHTLPWRKTKDPYRILVSEVMLQQTQVPRVIPKYRAFLKRFPSVPSLAQAPLREVLILWQGLGYNRRARFLHECAKRVVAEYDGKLPTAYAELLALPGIGPYTAGAVCTFAKNTPLVLVETNIRTVFLHHLFSDEKDVSDSELHTYVERAVRQEQDPRSWYWALMDYGSYLKAQGVRTHRNSKHYTKQSAFKGSDREVRGAILRVLANTKTAHVREIATQTGLQAVRIREQLTVLAKEGMVHQKGRSWSL